MAETRGMRMRKSGGNGVIAIAAVFILLFVAAMGLSEARITYKRTIEDYKVPDVTLVNQDGKRISLKALLDTGKPVMLDFIYGTCTTICPVLSAGFSNFQKKMGPESPAVRLVSISIDPDNDTPAVMKEYLKRYNAQPGWDFLTGKREDVIRVMKSFDAYVINKMNHYPLTILHVPGDPEWVRINGLLGTSDLIKEYETLIKK